jgi:hypothetical protein
MVEVILMCEAPLSTEQQFHRAGGYFRGDTSALTQRCDICAGRDLDPDQGHAGPIAPEVQQGNGPDAVSIPIPFRETEYVGP